MTEINSLSKNRSTIGDTAVDGLLSGLIGGVAMGLFLVVTGFFNGESLAVVIKKFSLLEEANLLTGLLTHLAISSVYGVFFSLVFHPFAKLWRWIKYPLYASISGMAFGFILWLLARYIFLVRTAPGLQSMPNANFLLGHLIYGFALGFSLQRRHDHIEAL